MKWQKEDYLKQAESYNNGWGCVSHNTPSEFRWSIHVQGICVYVTERIFLLSSFQLGMGFLLCLMSFVDKITHTMLKLFPNISTALEQLCIFKTSAIAELPAAFKQAVTQVLALVFSYKRPCPHYICTVMR